MPIQKDKLYEMYTKSAERTSKLREDAVRKHLDLPVEDDVQINNNGIAGKHIMGMVGMLLAAGSFVSWMALQPTSPAAPPQAVQQAPLEAQEYDVQFWFEDGTQISVEGN
jgi:hypothetical protein